MKSPILIKWGGICIYIFIVLWITLTILFNLNGIPTRPPTLQEWAQMLSGNSFGVTLSLFSISMFFWLVITLAVYDYLVERQYALARIGYGFALLLFMIIFLEIATLAAGRTIAEANGADVESDLYPIITLFGAEHNLAIWFHGLWFFFWGLGFIKIDGKERIVGCLLLTFVAFYIVFYINLRMGNVFVGELCHMAGHIMMLSSYVVLAPLLMKASKNAAWESAV